MVGITLLVPFKFTGKILIFVCFRPHLLSLDLSFNNLADLYHTINVLKTLPKLKNLVLQGNPLAVRNQGCFTFSFSNINFVTFMRQHLK